MDNIEKRFVCYMSSANQISFHVACSILEKAHVQPIAVSAVGCGERVTLYNKTYRVEFLTVEMAKKLTEFCKDEDGVSIIKQTTS